MLPPGFAMDANGMVFDLSSGTPLAVGYYPTSPPPHLMAYYGAGGQYPARTSGIPIVDPTYQTAKPAHKRQPSTIPASAARVAEFRPGSSSSDRKITQDGADFSSSGRASQHQQQQQHQHQQQYVDPAILSYGYARPNGMVNPYEAAYMPMQFMDPYAQPGTPPNAAAMAGMYGYSYSPAILPGTAEYEWMQQQQQDQMAAVAESSNGRNGAQRYY